MKLKRNSKEYKEVLEYHAGRLRFLREQNDKPADLETKCILVGRIYEVKQAIQALRGTPPKVNRDADESMHQSINDFLNDLNMVDEPLA